MERKQSPKNDDILYRRVKKHIEPADKLKEMRHKNLLRYFKDELGNYQVGPMAFYDKENRISVSTARDIDIVSKIQIEPENGVVKLIAEDVYEIDVSQHEVYIENIPDEENDNDEHCEISIIPDNNNIEDDILKEIRSDFRDSLAIIANATGWEIEPS